MSSASAAPAAHAHEAHAFDGEPVDVLPDDEPRTPGWLTVAGLVFFVGAAIVLLAGQDAAPPAAPTATMVVQQAQVQQAAPQGAPIPGHAAGVPGSPGAVRRLTPDQIQQIGQKRIEGAKGGMVPPGLPKQLRAPQPAH
jgi:hypothetical protein